MVSGHMRGMDEFEIKHLNRLERIRSLLEITPDTHITLVGDVMLDRFVTGEAETLATNGPAGGGGKTQSLRRTIRTYATYLPREQIQPNWQMVQ